MADSTHGRLLTEKEAQTLAVQAFMLGFNRGRSRDGTADFYAGEIDTVIAENAGTYPDPKEPVYVLRGASKALDLEILEAMEFLFPALRGTLPTQAVREWQDANPGRVKAPDAEKCAECGLSHDAVGPDGEAWHEGGECPGPPCVCGSGFPKSECADQTGHVAPDTEEGP